VARFVSDVWGLAVQGGTGGDAGTGGDEQNVRARWEPLGLLPGRRRQCGSMYALIVSDADMVDRHPEPVAQRGAEPPPHPTRPQRVLAQ
jgi:hypothetical protein